MHGVQMSVLLHHWSFWRRTMMLKMQTHPCVHIVKCINTLALEIKFAGHASRPAKMVSVDLNSNSRGWTRRSAADFAWKGADQHHWERGKKNLMQEWIKAPKKGRNIVSGDFRDKLTDLERLLWKISNTPAIDNFTTSSKPPSTTSVPITTGTLQRRP